MSELTLCNFCSLRLIKDMAARRGATVSVRQEPDGNLANWMAVRISDRDEPVAYFMQLTQHCVC